MQNHCKKKKHGSTTLPQDPCSLLLNHHSIYDRERVMVQEHHREFEAPWGLAMVGWSEDRSEPLCAVGIFCTGVYLRCLRHLYPPPGKQRRWPGVFFGMCLTVEESKKVAISPATRQQGLSSNEWVLWKQKHHLEEEGSSIAQPCKESTATELKKKKIQSVNKTTENKGGGVASPQASWIVH